MPGLSGNFIADMYGPTFLIFYIFFIIGVIILCRIASYFADTSLSNNPKPLPLKPDPYEIAYLRGGEAEVLRVIVFNLTERGYLLKTQDIPANATTVTSSIYPYVIKINPEAPDIRHLIPLEEYIFKLFAKSTLATDIFRKDYMPTQLEKYCQPYKEQAEREQLLITPGVKQTIDYICYAGLFAILAMGGYKLIVAISKGKSNFLFLLVLAVFGCLIQLALSGAPRISRRGQEYIDQMIMAYTSYKDRISTSQQALADPLLLSTVVGVFGVGILANSFYNDYSMMYRQAGFNPATSSWDSGGSWSSGSSSCSSSCSSGSSCGSSCGGGGCGGCGS